VQKRQPIEKQEAFLEYKQTEEGQQSDQNIMHHRQITRDRRLDIKKVTEELNRCKADIDRLKSKLDRKEHERRQRLQQEQA